MNKKMRKRVLSLALASAMAFSLMACGQEEETNTPGTAEYMYVPEYVDLGGSEEEWFNDVRLIGNGIYFTKHTSDAETGLSSLSFEKYSIEDGTFVQIRDLTESSGNLISYYVDEQENLYTVERVYAEAEPDSAVDYAYTEPETFLRKYDAQGTVVFEQNITDILAQDQENSYINEMTVDAQGRMYLCSSNLIRLFDEAGNAAGTVSISNGWINSMGQGKDGNVYLLFYDYASTAVGDSLAQIDFTAKSLGTSYANFTSSGNMGLKKALEKDFLGSDGSKLYQYDLATQTSEEILDWVDSDINGSYVEDAAALEDGRIAVVIRDWDTGKTELALLTKTSTADMAQRQQLVVGTLYASQELQRLVIEFNKKNQEYRISIKNYLDAYSMSETAYEDALANLNNDIISGSNAPDILSLSGLNYAQLATKGVFEDLTQYLDSSSVISRDDFVESVLNCFTFDDKLISIPTTFSLSTLVGKTSQVGEEMGWTLEELMAYSKEHPEAALFDGATKSSMLYQIMAYNENRFIDWEAGTCDFESDEFKMLLEFVAGFPDEYDWQSDERSTPSKLQAGDVLLDTVYISDYEDIQVQEAMFNEPVTYIGYPNQDGGIGCMLSPGESYGIAAQSSNKDGAWAFLESMLSEEDTSERFSWGFPTKKTKLEKKREEAVKQEFIKDETGELILDEEGNPIPEGGNSSIGYGDWSYTYRISTQEEADLVDELIANAQMAVSSDSQIMTIITEEAEGFFQGQQTVDAVAGVIQSRIKLYISENK